MQIHENHPGLKKFRQIKTEQKKKAIAKQMFPHAATETIRNNLMKMVARDMLVKTKKNK